MIDIIKLVLKFFAKDKVGWVNREKNREAYDIGQYGIRSQEVGLCTFNGYPIHFTSNN